MKHWRQKTWVWHNTHSAVLVLFGTQLVLVLVLYLSLQSVGEILLDSPERLSQFQDGVIWEFTGGDLPDVDHLTGPALNHKQRGDVRTDWDHHLTIDDFLDTSISYLNVLICPQLKDLGFRPAFKLALGVFVLSEKLQTFIN